MKYVKLVRWPNLVIALATQLIFYGKVVIPGLAASGLQPILSRFSFLVLVIGTVSVMAGGYIINDLEDEIPDRINRDSSVLIGKQVNRTTAWSLYLAMVVITVLIAGYFFITGLYYTGMALILALVALFIYSKHLQGIPFLGNLVIAALSGLVVIILLISELPGNGEAAFRRTSYILFAFGLFAFLTTLVREVIKDIEDMKGDHQSNLTTIATLWGAAKARRTSLLISGILWFSLLLASLREWTSFSVLGKTYAVLLMSFLTVIMILIFRSRKQEDFTSVSRALKAFMGAGLFFVIYWNV